jgi:antitoxin (DNA-binding transcriptional repressor) of toxin-antitoxin stability system
MKIKGIKRGKIIELSEEVNIPDGSEVLIEIQETQLISEEEKRKRLHELLDSWEAREEFVELLTALDRKRHANAEVKVNPSKVIEVAISGEEVVITRDNQPVVKLVSPSPVKRRPKFGSAKGLVTISDDFDEPLEDFKDYM